MFLGPPSGESALRFRASGRHLRRPTTSWSSPRRSTRAKPSPPGKTSEGVVVLLDDIDMTGVDNVDTDRRRDLSRWPVPTPSRSSSGRPFTGFFDGQGHSISNLQHGMRQRHSQPRMGILRRIGPRSRRRKPRLRRLLFAGGQGLERHRLRHSGRTWSTTLPCAISSTNAPMSFDGSAGNVRMTMGMVGLAFASKGVVLDRLTNEAALTSEDGGNNRQRMRRAYTIGGICGFSTNHASSANPVVVHRLRQPRRPHHQRSAAHPASSPRPTATRT